MTALTSLGRRGWETARSVRQHALRVPLVDRLLVGLLALLAIVDGARAFFPFYIRGDLLYHWGLARTILHGQFPPGGPYEGLPAYYPPGFHLLLAAGSRLSGLDVTAVTMILGLAWLPVLPLTTYLLARRLTGRPNVAILAAVLTAFGGGFDLSPDRLWVNSLFPSGQEAYPLYPRDLVFGLLPLAIWAFIRALDEPGRWLRWSLFSGAILGICGLIQVQLLLPIPLVLGVPAVALAWRQPAHRRTVLASLAVAGLVALGFVAPWIVEVAGQIGRNGGVALDSADSLQPARFGFWSYPVQFGLLLPLAVMGSGVVLLFLRRADGPRPGGVRSGPWSPRPAEGALALLPWFAVPFALAVLYNPGWPLEDALRPQRMWLLAGQPAAILAAIGLVAVAEDVIVGAWGRARLVVPVIAAVVVIMTVPATLATARLLSIQWTDNEYANLHLDADHVPDFQALLGTAGPRQTVLTYEDWSSLAWYQAGAAVVAVKPPGYAKLAFDPKVLTGHGQAERRRDLAAAMTGDPTTLGRIAEVYGAQEILLARRGDRWGIVDVVASLAMSSADSGATAREGNGWDLVDLAAGGRLVLPTAVTGPLDLELRFEGKRDNASVPARRFRLLAGGIAGGERPLADLVVPPSGPNDWEVLHTSIDLGTGESLLLEALDPLSLQSVRGFASAAPPTGWQVVSQTADAVLLGRVP